MKNRLLKCILVFFVVFTISTLNLVAAELNKGIVSESILAYNAPTIEAEVSCYISEGEELIIAYEIDGFYGVFIENNEVVYIEKAYMQVQDSESKEEIIQEDNQIQNIIDQKSTQSTQSTQGTQGEEVVNYAKQFIGLRYRSGGANLQTGVDCSGFTQQIFEKFNIKLQRSSRDQYALNGKAIARAELIPGDLVFYGVSGRVRHVAIYIGDDQIIHAPVPGKSVCIVPIQQRGSDPIIGYRRIL